MKDWALIITAFGGISSLVIGIVAFFVSPASERIAWRRKGEDKTTYMASLVSAFRVAYTNVRERLLTHEPDAIIATDKEIVDNTRAQLEELNQQ